MTLGSMKPNASPPQLPLRFFRWFCHPKMQDYIEGDLMEVYERRIKESGMRKADLRFMIDVLLLFRPGIIKPVYGHKHVNTYGMYKSYFKIGWRTLVKNKVYSFISIIGLSIGMAACLLILQYVSFQLSYDQFNENAADLYRVYNDRYQDGKLIQHGTITYSAIGKAMKDDFPEVINYARVEPMNDQILIYHDDKIGDQKGLAVDNSFLTMFSYPIIAGDRQTALEEPNNIILSETLARKIFKIRDNDFESVIGKEVIMQWDSLPNKITAICEDVPENSHLSFDFLWSYVSLYTGPYPWREADHNFSESSFWHYIQLNPGADHKALEAKLPAFSQRHFQGNKVSGSDESFYLQPLLKAHLYSDFEYEIGNTTSASVVWGLLIIAGLIMVIAWVNYINLATVKSMERAKEVGIRKVSGATKLQLVGQFLAESCIVNLAALIIAFAVVSLVQISFNNLVQHELSLSYLFYEGLNVFTVSAAFIVMMISGIFASGFYPAFVLSSFEPAGILKGKFTVSAKGIVLRKILVAGQFTVTIVLIIGSLVVYRQIRFIGNQNLGFNLSQIMAVKGPQLTDFDTVFLSRQYSFLAELKQLPGVENAAFSRWLPGEEMSRSFDVYRSDLSSESQLTFRRNTISHDFISVYQMKLLAGRDFAETDYHYDFRNLHNTILNETAVKLLGFASPEEAIGKQINRGTRAWDIVGVVADFHQKSLRHPIEPTFFIPNSSTWNPFSIRVKPHHLPETIAAIRKKYEEFFPGNLFDYSFVDERFNAQYRNEHLFGNVFIVFTGLAIFVASLGLLGLSLFATLQRTKEIGIRKVLGASVSGIVTLLSKDFVKLVAIAIAIASPIAWWAMTRWLEDFAYHIDIEWWMFVASGLATIFIALFTVGVQSIKVALASPVDSLRSE